MEAGEGIKSQKSEGDEDIRGQSVGWGKLPAPHELGSAGLHGNWCHTDCHRFCWFLSLMFTATFIYLWVRHPLWGVCVVYMSVCLSEDNL